MRVLRIKVKPNARKQEIREEADGSWVVQLKSPPIDGKANEELIQLLSKTFKLPKSCISIKSGAGGRNKLVMLNDD
ncbi:MAG TPA: DUF167 domain-containing protein [Leptolyngbyaceae cyanobacterium M33_DOE_097]|uniref:UPF0235 protein ENR64_11430 n=1 Tax=Oscillatoriales cyanobacterium SpSt-418 TaxID=2282169 RepID=A0A7C3KEZ9_9CYAN|nr:DUF167 domain-containing protein [Leptolyngbyaceae cyanobacterium M33_DOE_097]